MKKLLLTTALTLALASGAQAFQSGTNKDPNFATAPRSTIAAIGTADGVLQNLNKKGAYAADFYRMSFMQVMGLVFFDPNTPDIRSCEKELLNYHLPELTNAQFNFNVMRTDITKIMSEVYTTEELAWMQSFYASPFGQRMISKQYTMNERITRLMAQRYANLKPSFQETYAKVAKSCGNGSAMPLDAPNLSDAILNPPAH